ncbi:MAG: DUF4087 domain-containing protein [Burkholderiales bacterium]|nr:DUF4087 domain-containing protein [Burkholderiales bacterium]
MARPGLKHVRLNDVRIVALALLLVFEAGFACAQASDRGEARKAETRCGWWSNPTPQNVSLFDRDGEWIVGIQGGHQAEGDWPDFKDSEWVNTNRHYGYGCACLTVVLDPRSHEVIRIRAAHARPLRACRQDPALKGVAP